MRQLYLLDTSALERGRLSKGLLKHEIATLANISIASVSEAFNSGNVGIRVARSIAAVLGLHLVDLLVLQKGQTG